MAIVLGRGGKFRKPYYLKKQIYSRMQRAKNSIYRLMREHMEAAALAEGVSLHWGSGTRVVNYKDEVCRAHVTTEGMKACESRIQEAFDEFLMGEYWQAYQKCKERYHNAINVIETGEYFNRAPEWLVNVIDSIPEGLPDVRKSCGHCCGGC